MRKIFSYTVGAVLILFLALSCSKEETKEYFRGGTNPQLTANPSQVILEPGEEANTALQLSWTNPNNVLSTGISSLNVNYLVEIDTVGGNFNSSNKYSTLVSNDLQLNYTVSQLNAILGNDMLLQLVPRRGYQFESRITSFIAGTNNGTELGSNVVSFSASPFPPPPKVQLPGAGTLWVTGDAFASGWANPLPAPYDVSQMFTQLTSLTTYELIVDMIPGGGYKLIQSPGDWGTQYHMVAGGTATGGKFEFGDANPAFPAPDEAGTYKLTFDFQVGTFKVEKQ